MHIYYRTVLVALVAMFVASVWEVTCYRKVLHLQTDNTALYDATYQVVDVQAPALAGWKLVLFARLLLSSPLGDWLARRLLLKNGVTDMIELADAIQSESVGKEFGLGEPLIRLSRSEYDWHVRAAAKNDENHIRSPTSRYRTVRQFHEAYTKKTTTPSEVLDKLIHFISATNETLRCVEDLNVEQARQAALESTQRYQQQQPLSVWDGVPVMFKSQENVRGMRTSHGHAPKYFAPSTTDGVIAQRFRRAGAILVATTVMHEQGVQPTGHNPYYGGPQNPFALHHLPGGSSSGSAVAVATGMVPVAIGFDGGGSIRVPGAWSGCVGLAVSYGRVPCSSKSTNLMSVMKGGPISGTVEDAAEALMLLGPTLTTEEDKDKHLYHVLHGGDGLPPPHLLPRWHDNEQPVVKIGIFSDWVSHRATGTSKGADDAVYQTFQKTLQRLQNKNDGIRYEVVEFKMPHMRLQALAHGILISSMFSFAGIKELYKETSSRERDDVAAFQPATQVQIKLGQQVSGLELIACMRIRAFAVAMWRDTMTKTADVILTPTTPMTAVKKPSGSDWLGFSDVSMFIAIMRFVWPANLTGLPGLAVPTGVDSVGFPVSMQVMCLHWHEADCLAVGADIEKLFAGERPLPPQNLFVDLLESTASTSL